MRNPKIVTICLLFLLSIISCRRESLKENKEAETVFKPLQGKSPTLEKIANYKASSQEIASAKKAWLAGIKRPSMTAARGGCGEHISDFVKLVDVQSGSCGFWTIRYTIMSYDLVGSGYEQDPVIANFTDLNFQPITATLISSSATLVDPGCDAWYYDGYCEMVREYVYELSNIPFQSVAPSSVGQYSLELLSGFSTNCTPLTASGSLPGTVSAAFYAGNPARIYVQPSSNSPIFIATDCSGLCYHPYFCPDYGTFTYWPLSNPSNTTTINISTVGTLLSLPSGAYGYSATLTYTIGGNTITSLPNTGTFIIN